MKQNATSIFSRKGLALRLLCLVLALTLFALAGCKKTPPQGDDPSGDTTVVDNKPTDLKVNLLSAPFGVDKDDLRFSWVMNDSEEVLIVVGT